jgi:hypothetical protein
MRVIEVARRPAATSTTRSPPARSQRLADNLKEGMLLLVDR